MVAKRTLTAWLLALLASCAWAAEPEPAKEPTAEDKADMVALDASADRLRAHDPTGAIRSVEPIIQRYEAQRARDAQQRLYSARSQPETLFYLLQAAAGKQSAAVVGPALVGAYYQKGFALIEAGKLAQARATFEQGLEVAPMNSPLLSELAYTYQQERNWPKMLELFKQAVRASEFSPESEKAHEKGRALRGQGFALIELKRLDEAEQVFKDCLAMDPNDDKAKNELSYIAGLRRQS